MTWAAREADKRARPVTERKISSVMAFHAWHIYADLLEAGERGHGLQTVATKYKLRRKSFERVLASLRLPPGVDFSGIAWEPERQPTEIRPGAHKETVRMADLAVELRGQGKTQEEIGADLGVTREYARQLLKMRGVFGRLPTADFPPCAECEKPVKKRGHACCSHSCASRAKKKVHRSRIRAKLDEVNELRANGHTWDEVAEMMGFPNAMQAYQASLRWRKALGEFKP